MNLKERISSDTYRVFLRDTDFAEAMTIGTNSKNAVEVVASLQANEVDLTSGGTASLQAFSYALYCEYPIGGELELNAGQILYINNISYRVIDFNNEMGVATVHLKRG
jgi:hypothetical protein